MNFIEEERGYSDREEQEEDEEEVMISKLPFSSPSSSSSSTKNRNFLTQPQSVWVADSFESRQDHKNQEPHLNFDKKLEFVDLSLGSANEADSSGGGDGGGGDGGGSGPIEREHMFDKVVTPSDVGKLNRLVIPKQHAEKYFPLDSSSNEKGLLLNFEDPSGKLWRFRYSYWNSSQSYVMTKGWSRFVKEKKLDAGDIVSFQRGVGSAGNHRLFIDWRRRPNAPDPTSLTHLEFQNRLHFPQSVRWSRLYSLPQPLSMPRQYHHQQTQMQHLNYGIQPYHHHHDLSHQYHYHHHHQPAASYGYAPHYYLRQQEAYPIGSLQQQGVLNHAPVVIDSVPVVHGKPAGKRLRLFGVNMECPTTQEEPSSLVPIPHGTVVGPFPPHLASSSLPPPVQLRVSDDAPIPTLQAEFSKKGKTSLSLDLDI